MLSLVEEFTELSRMILIHKSILENEEQRLVYQ